MIYFVVRRAAIWGVEDYLEYWGRSMAPLVGTVCYEDLGTSRELPQGTYIFTQKDELLPTELELAAVVWDQLRETPGVRLLNHPKRVLGRYDLLRTLHARGINDFKAVRATEDMSGLRFPAFLREERWHTGGLTDLVHSPEELNRALLRLLFRGWRRSDLLAVEYSDTANAQGIYRKYSAYIVGEAIVPRSIQENTDWMVKSGYREVDEESANEEMEYVETNPHEAWLRTVADLANVDYGRVDYALKGDQPLAWEINLFPTLVRPSWSPRTTSDHIRAIRKPGKTLFFAKLESALKAVNTQFPSGMVAEIRVKGSLKRRIVSDRRRARLRSLHRTTVKRVSAWPALNPVRRMVHSITQKAPQP